MGNRSLKKDVTDNQIVRHLAENSDYRFLTNLVADTGRRSLKQRHDRRQRKCAEEGQQQRNGSSGNDTKAPRQSHIPLSDDKRLYLKSIVDHPNLTITGRRDFLGWPSDQANIEKRELLETGLVSEFTANPIARSGTVKLLELTETGYRALGKRAPKSRPQNCSAEHWFYQNILADLYRSRGFEVNIEHTYNSARADVVVSKNGEKLAIEIACSPNNEARNVQRNLKAGMDRVIVACRTTAVKRAVESRLDAAGICDDRVTVKCLSDFPFPRDLFSVKCDGADPHNA